MKNLLTVCLVLVAMAFAGCASTADKTKSLDKLSNAEIEAYNNNPDNTDKIVCRTESDIGSRIPKKVCRMESVIDNRSRQDQRALENIQKRQGVGTVRDPG